MIHLEAVYHRASQQFCYALDEEILMVGLQTGEEVEQVWIHYGDPFSTGILGGNEAWEGSREEIVTKMRLPKHLWWEIPVQPPYKRCRYFFELQAGAERVFYFEDGFHSPEDVKNGQLGQCFTFPWMNSADINVTPKWVRETVWYQIFPERFCNGNKENDPDWVKPWGYHTVSNLDFYGGDLDGIRQKLPYLQELGITGLYLTPLFESPSSHKYDTTDYRKIDPGFGDEETMKLLVKEAHDRGIRVMLDGVFNHCGSNFLPWRDVMEKGPQSPYYKSGIEVGTEKAWELCEKYKLPRFVYVTNMDVDNASYRQIVEDLKEKYGKKIAPFNLPIRENEHFVGYVNVVSETGNRWQGKEVVPCEIPDYNRPNLEICRETLMEAVAETSEAFMERYFGGETFSESEIRAALRTNVIDGSIVPVSMGSNTLCQGVYTLLDDIVKYVPSPEDRICAGISLKTNGIFQADYDFSKAKSAYIYKTISDPFIGKYSLIKVCSGVLKTDDTMYNSDSDVVLF